MKKLVAIALVVSAISIATASATPSLWERVVKWGGCLPGWCKDK